jgi:hypothetical protein
MDLRDLTALAAEIHARSQPDAPDSDKDEAFEDRYGWRPRSRARGCWAGI